MKVVINVCFGGFGLSNKAVKRLAELQGRECYFYKGLSNYRITDEEATKTNSSFVTASDIPDFNEHYEAIKASELKQRKSFEASNAFYAKHIINSYQIERTDPLLIRVVEELGEEADGPCARLKIVEIPDGVNFVIDEYDGNESIHEAHQSWS